jgi:hypothetical protein
LLLGLAFIPKSQTAIILAVYLLGKGASGAGFQMVWMYTNELYPTNLRGQVTTSYEKKKKIQKCLFN